MSAKFPVTGTETFDSQKGDTRGIMSFPVSPYLAYHEITELSARFCR